MPTFDFTYTVRAPLSAVAGLNSSSHALKLFTPPPIWVQLHSVEPLAEGSRSVFTLWFGLVPIRWTALHSDVDHVRGFTDTQVCGPVRSWVHTHTFTEHSPGLSRINEHIEYEHFPGARGVLSRLLFSPIGLRLAFGYRRFVTRRILEKSGDRAAE